MIFWFLVEVFLVTSNLSYKSENGFKKSEEVFSMSKEIFLTEYEHIILDEKVDLKRFIIEKIKDHNALLEKAKV